MAQDSVCLTPPPAGSILTAAHVESGLAKKFHQRFSQSSYLANLLSLNQDRYVDAILVLRYHSSFRDGSIAGARNSWSVTYSA